MDNEDLRLPVYGQLFPGCTNLFAGWTPVALVLIQLFNLSEGMQAVLQTISSCVGSDPLRAVQPGLQKCIVHRSTACCMSSPKVSEAMYETDEWPHGIRLNWQILFGMIT